MPAGNCSPGRRCERALRALASPPLPPPPDPRALLGGASRRPGELHEAVTLPADTAIALEREAARAGVDRDVLAGATLELMLLEDDLGGSCLESLTPPTTRVDGRALSAAEADYLRTLTMTRSPRPRRSQAAATTVAIPVRIVGRISPAHLKDTFDARRVDLALAWETAALMESRTLSECVLFHATRESLQSSICSPGAACAPESRPSKTAW
jgi:hypothetical protein